MLARLFEKLAFSSGIGPPPANEGKVFPGLKADTPPKILHCAQTVTAERNQAVLYPAVSAPDSSARAAANRAIGTRYGEQET